MPPKGVGFPDPLSGTLNTLKTLHGTTHSKPMCKGVARNIDTGELRNARVSIKRGRLNMQLKPAPKSWAKLKGKSAKEIVSILGLTDFDVLLGVKDIEVDHDDAYVTKCTRCGEIPEPCKCQLAGKSPKRIKVREEDAQ